MCVTKGEYGACGNLFWKESLEAVMIIKAKDEAYSRVVGWREEREWIWLFIG